MAKVKAQSEKKDGGYYFPQFDIHVVASTEKAAKEFIKKHYGFEPDEQAQLLSDLAAEAEKNAQEEAQPNKK